ncbi:MAG: MoxR-like ATPase [Oleispira sp.]
MEDAVNTKAKDQAGKKEKNKVSKTTDTVLLQPRITNIIQAISSGMHEREEIMAVALLGALSGQNTFLFGPPGTAKSLISRRLACAFQEPSYFECLMNRFTEPSEVVGPVSVKALKEDKYTRKTEGYLPTADFAFLDEIWKSSPAILNTLLTIINEHIYRNGDEITQVPLKALIAASNETPQENQGLEALYDRFIIRMLVPPIQLKQNFDDLLSAKPNVSSVEISSDLLITQEEWMTWQKELHSVELSKETMNIIHLIRNELSEKSEELKVYVSDRRWQRAAMLMKASGYFCDRTETNHSDAMLLKYCLWTTPENREEIANIVKSAITACGFDAPLNMAEIQEKKESLEQEIEEELYHQTDVYHSVSLNSEEFFNFNVTFTNQSSSVRPSNRNLFISVADFKSKGAIHPINRQGNELVEIDIDFDEQGSCFATYNSKEGKYEKLKLTPTVKYKKGAQKTDVNKRLIEALVSEVKQLKSQLLVNEQSISQKSKSKIDKLNTPFISSEDALYAIKGFHEQGESLELKIKDCDRLESLCS